MLIVIDIPGYVYEHIQESTEDSRDETIVIDAVKKGILLDKIRAEIDGAKMPKNRMSFFRDGVDCALQIIDKYRTESEVSR